MRIGIDTLFLNGSQRSSLANFVVALVEAMVEQPGNHRLVLFTSPTTSRFFTGLPPGSVEMVNCPVSNERRLARILYQQLRLPGLVARHRIDVLCCLADVAPLRVKVPIVLKVNSLHHLTAPHSLGRRRSFYRRFMIRASVRQARLIIANSRPAAADIQSLLGVARERIRLVYEAVDDYFAPCPDQAQVVRTLRDRYGISNRFLLFVSALYRYKNLDALIRAFGPLVATGRWSGDLVVVGPDPHGDRQRSEDLATSLKVRDRVKFLGAVPNENLRDLYCGASVFVYPSASETFGKPIVEAMRCGTPIVAANRGSIPDIAAGAALLVDPDDTDGLGAAIMRLLGDEHLRTHLRDRGLQRGQDFSWRVVARSFTQVLEEASA
jgi:glycosyltransferase involved in cell wall biosynthesis